MAVKKGFDKAFEELKTIVDELQGDDISVDKLSDKIKRAKLLLNTTKQKLRDVELDIKSIIEKD